MWTLFFCRVVSIFLSFFFPCLISAAADWMSTILRHMGGPSANLECRSEMCCTWLAANAGPKKIAIWHCRTTFSGYIFATKAHVDSLKKLVKQQYLSTCPHNMVNFGPLAAEIVSLVWGTPGNFNEFCILAALLLGTLVVGVSQTAALNRGRHLYSAGRPSRWALAHISSFCFFKSLFQLERRVGLVI